MSYRFKSIEPLLPMRVLLLLGLCLSLTNAQERVAVFPFDSQPKEWGELFAERISSEISKTGRFQVVDRMHLHDVILEQNMQLTGATEEMHLKIGQLIGVRYIITGSIVQSPTQGGRLFFSAKMISIETGEVYRTGSYDTFGAFTIAVRTATQSLADQLSGITSEKVINPRRQIVELLLGLTILIAAVWLPLAVLNLVL